MVKTYLKTKNRVVDRQLQKNVETVKKVQNLVRSRLRIQHIGNIIEVSQGLVQSM